MGSSRADERPRESGSPSFTIGPIRQHNVDGARTGLPKSETPKVQDIVQELRAQGNPKFLKGMARFAITTGTSCGVSVPTVRSIAKKIGKNHGLALDLWSTGYHDARLLATMIDDPLEVSEGQMEIWARDFDSWDVVDQCCGNVFCKTPFAVKKSLEWSGRGEEFVKRAGFSLMAYLAVHDKKAPNKTFLAFLPVISREASDERSFVRKAVNWALRQIGKRNLALNNSAISTAKEIGQLESKAARWIARDALRELTSKAVLEKMRSDSE